MKRTKGWVDLQVNGYLGVDFSNGNLTKDDFIRACRKILSSGTEVFLPTMITSSEETYERNLPMMAEIICDREFERKIPGFHLEGPFISPKKGVRGIHALKWIKKADVKYLDRLSFLSGGKIRLLTVAAELDGVGKLIRHASASGITVSLGHQLADASQIAKAAAEGAKALTHLGNGLPQILPRHPNTLWDGIAEDSLSAMIITDGHHIPPSVIKTIIKTKGVDKCIVVSDAAPVAGLFPGKYRQLGCDVVLTEEGRLCNPRLGCLAGSSFNMAKCMRYLKGLGILSEKELFKIGFENPLRCIKLNYV